VRYDYGYLAVPMNFAQNTENVLYTVGSLRELLARATLLRSGDVLSGVAARRAEECVAAQFALADVS
jgi:ethanolamine ammonia-lyase large subunit